jgi:hypothetical protein
MLRRLPIAEVAKRLGIAESTALRRRMLLRVSLHELFAPKR